jgi:hypothetical protein
MSHPLKNFLIFLTGFLTLAFLVESSSLQAEDIAPPNKKHDVFTFGEAAIKDGNLARAKEKAISQALMKGVENYLVNRLEQSDLINNFERIITDIIPRTKEEISSFNILSQGQIKNRYRVLVQIRVNDKLMTQHLRVAGVVLRKGSPVKALCMVSETHAGKTACWWEDPEAYSSPSLTELALYKIFQQRGFVTVNRISGLPESQYYSNLTSLSLRDADFVRWGEILSAEVVIAGRTQIIDGKKVSLALRAFDVKSGIKIYQDHQTKRIEGQVQGREQLRGIIEQLARQAAAHLVPAILRFKNSKSEVTHTLEVTLEDLNSFSQSRTFSGFLKKKVKGVKSVRQTRLKQKTVSFMVEFEGGRDVFLERVLSHKEPPFLLSFVQTDDERIAFKVEE